VILADGSCDWSVQPRHVRGTVTEPQHHCTGRALCSHDCMIKQGADFVRRHRAYCADAAKHP
jgi:hypothetical protein